MTPNNLKQLQQHLAVPSLATCIYDYVYVSKVTLNSGEWQSVADYGMLSTLLPPRAGSVPAGTRRVHIDCWLK